MTNQPEDRTDQEIEEDLGDGVVHAEQSTTDVVEDGTGETDDANLSAGAFVLVALASLVLVAGGAFVGGMFLVQESQTETAQAEAEAVIAEYNPREFITEFNPEDLGSAADNFDTGETPDSVPLTDEVVTTTTTTIPEGFAAQTEVAAFNPADIALVYVSRVPGDEYGQVGYITLTGERGVTELECQRIDWNRGAGLCLQGSGVIGTGGRGVLLDGALRATSQFDIADPSRATVSDDGSLVAWTGFTLGHDYLAAGEFATTTQVIHPETGAVLDLEFDLEPFDINGEEIFDNTRNFWGVTYVDDSTFYATMGLGGLASVVRGDLENGRIDVVHENASCPEISPDRSTIVAKEQRGDAFQLVAIDVATGERRDLAETRSVDDQVEWIDDTSIVYALPNDGGTVAQPSFDIWLLNTTDGSEPQLLVPFADSPAAA